MEANGTPTKRRRATRAQRLEREQAILRLLDSHLADVKAAAKTAGLTYSEAATTLRRLEGDQLVERTGKEGRRVIFSITDLGRQILTETENPTAVELEPLPFSEVLAKIHLGGVLQVVGFHLSEGTPVIDLRSEDDSLVHATLTTA